MSLDCSEKEDSLLDVVAARISNHGTNINGGVVDSKMDASEKSTGYMEMTRSLTKANTTVGLLMEIVAVRSAHGDGDVETTTDSMASDQSSSSTTSANQSFTTSIDVDDFIAAATTTTTRETKVSNGKDLENPGATLGSFRRTQALGPGAFVCTPASATTAAAAAAAPSTASAPPPPAPERATTMQLYEEFVRDEESTLSVESATSIPRPTRNLERYRNLPMSTSLPGALAVEGPGLGIVREDSATATSIAADQASSYSLSPQPPTNNHSGLAVASLVDEDEDELPQAENYDAEENHKRRRQETKQIKTYVLLGVLGLTALIIILVAVTIPKSSSSNEQQVLLGNSEHDPASAIVMPTDSPSEAPSSTNDLFMSLLPDSTTQAMQDPNSPQQRAFEWLVDDVFQGLLPDLSVDRMVQRFALATLFFATGGEKWTQNTHWLDHSVHECDWHNAPEFAVKTLISREYPGYLDGFFSSTEPAPTQCDEDTGLYEHLWLDMNSLQGFLPDELYLLTSLKTFSVAFNQLYGTIATQIGQLTNLEGLYIGSVEQGGRIPSELGLLTNLRALNLRENGHVGSVPDELWQLSKLDTLTIGLNPELQGTIPPDSAMFQSIRWLVLDSCSFEGTLPTELGTATNLQWLIVLQNSLTGVVPSELGQLSTLQYLSTWQNLMTGTIPPELGELPSLYILALSNNLMSGKIPSQLGRLSWLSWNTLKWNQLTGTIPTELGLYPHLEKLDLSANQLTGTIPSELGMLSSLGHLSLSYTFLSGTVPSELANLREPLHKLWIQGIADLTGTIPAPLCNISKTCMPSAFGDCYAPFGLVFNCSEVLCGCDCPCLDG